MRIAILSPFYPYRGGLAQFAERLYQELQERHEVEVFSYTTLYPKLLFPGKTQFVTEATINSSLPSTRILSTTNFFSYKKTAKAINDYNPDVVIIAYWMPYIAFALKHVCTGLNKNIKTVVMVHNAIPHEKSKLDRPLGKYFFKRCDAFICMSNIVHRDLVDMGLDTPILIHEHPIYDRYLPKIDRQTACRWLEVDPHKKTLLFFGLIRAYKGLDLLIEAMGKLDDSYQLLIAGECYGAFESYQQLIDLSKNRANIKVWNQYIQDDLVTVLFSASDALVLPYRSATQSGVIAVAYQMGTPIIATDVGALGEMIRNAGTGMIVPSVSAEAIAEKIKDYFSEGYETRYSINLEKEKGRLSWNSFTKSIEQFIEGL